MLPHRHTLFCIEQIERRGKNGKREQVLACRHVALTPRRPYRARSPKHLTLGDVVYWWVVAPPPGPF